MADIETERLTITLPPEAERHGDYIEVTVVADDGSQATVKRNRQHNPMMVLYERGSIDEDQFEAATEIIRAAELIGRAVGVRGASLEARVDCSGASRDMLIEHIGRVHLERTYSVWRDWLPTPKRMVIDVIVDGRPLKATSLRHRMDLRKGRKWVISALNYWIKLRAKIRDEIEEREVEAVYHRIGEGKLL